MFLKKLFKFNNKCFVAGALAFLLISGDCSSVLAAQLSEPEVMTLTEVTQDSQEDPLLEAQAPADAISADSAEYISESESCLSGEETPLNWEIQLAENEGKLGETVDDDEDTLVERGDIVYNVTAMASALDGAINDPAAFSASITLVKENPVVKLKWKVPDGKSYTLYRLNTDGELEYLDVRSSKKNYTDSDVFNDDNNTSIYFLRSFSKEGVEKDYVTIPSTQVLACDGGTVEDTIQFVITCASGPVRYKMERTSSKDKTFAEAETYTIYNSDIIDQSLSVTGADIKAKTLNFSGRAALSFTDKEVKADENYVYRFTSEIDLPGIDVSSLVTKTTKAKTSYYAAPEIEGIYNSNDDHTICYKDATIYVGFPDGYPDIDAVIEIERAGVKGSYKKLIKQDFADFTKVTINGVASIKVPYDHFDPEVTYYYRARYTVSGKKSGNSLPYEATCHFDTVNVVEAEEEDFKSVGLTWTSDECALRYDIYRTENVWDSASKALAEAADYDIKQFKKVYSVKTVDLSAGTELSFTDTKGLELGVYHAYRIVPVNKKSPEFTSDVVPLLACKIYPASPDEVVFTPQGMNQVQITWSKSTGAVVYKIQRTDTADYLGEPIWDEDEWATVNIREWEFESGEEYSYTDYSDINNPRTATMRPFDATTFIQNSGDGEDDLVKGQHYYYRVLAACKVDDVVLWADESTANYVEVYLQPKPVTGFSATLMSTASSVTVNYAKLSFGVPDDYASTIHYEVTYSIGDKSGYDNHVSTSISYNGTMAAGTAVTKQYSGITRGKNYYFAVRPVYSGSDMTITGSWQEIRFMLPVEIYAYPDGKTKTYENDSDSPYVINSGSSKDFILEYNPSNSTFLDTTVTLSSSSYFTLTYYPESVVKRGKYKGKHYFTVKAKSGYSYSYTANVTVTAVNYSKTASGDVASQLKKILYLKMQPESTTS